MVRRSARLGIFARAEFADMPGGLKDLKAGTAPDPQTFTTANVPDQMMSMQPNEMKKVQKAYTVCPNTPDRLRRTD